MPNRIVQDGNTFEEVAAADIAAGSFVFTSSGIAKFYASLGKGKLAAHAGNVVRPLVGGVTVEIDKANPDDEFVQGEPVYGCLKEQNAVATGGDGQLGVASKDSPKGATSVFVRMIN